MQEYPEPGVLRETFRCLLRSPWTSWVGLRYLKSKKHSRFLSFITLISMIGVALGVTALVVVLSVMDGFEVEMRKRLMNQDLHLLITPKGEGVRSGAILGKSFEDSPLAQKLKASNEVKFAHPILQTEAILRGGKKVSGVVIKGVEPPRLSSLEKTLTESASSPLGTVDLGSQMGGLPKIFLGQSLADEMGLIPGEIVTLISPTETEGPLSSIPRLKRFFVAGIYRSGSPEQELHTVYTEIGAVRSFLKRSGAVSQWEIVLNDFNQASHLKNQLQRESGEFLVQDWMDLNSHLFASLRLERLAMFISLAFIVIVASFNIVTTLTLMVLEKKREISIMKAMGARDPEIGAVFLAEGLLIGGVGIGSGMVLGFGICYALRRWQFVQLPDVYFDRTLPVSFLPQYYAIVAVAAFIIVLCASVYPSLRAARTDPLNGIRFGA